jgi:hypothetical protein
MLVVWWCRCRRVCEGCVRWTGPEWQEDRTKKGLGLSEGVVGIFLGAPGGVEEAENHDDDDNDTRSLCALKWRRGNPVKAFPY